MNWFLTFRREFLERYSCRQKLRTPCLICDPRIKSRVRNQWVNRVFTCFSLDSVLFEASLTPFPSIWGGWVLSQKKIPKDSGFFPLGGRYVIVPPIHLPGSSASLWPFKEMIKQMKGCWWPTQRLGDKRMSHVTLIVSPGIPYIPDAKTRFRVAFRWWLIVIVFWIFTKWQFLRWWW